MLQPGCNKVGGVTSKPIECRVYVCGRVMIERRDRVLSDGALAGPQGRLLFAFLATRRNQPISKTEVIDAVWGTRTPPSADTTINAITSKLRAALRTLGIPAPHGVATEVGTYQLLVPNAWIDLEHARMAIDRAEGALRRDAPGEAWPDANVAAAIASQSFLPEEQHPWVHRQRETLARVLRRALLVLSVVSTRNGEYELGIQHAAEALSAEPFDELACQALMRAHAAAGNRAEALRVYSKCRKLFRDELGATPSPQTEAVFLQILRAAD
ncbi:MAG TPA: BTAD domain-containing putative transcriptional regulator [Vicinamibacterales bacterium]|nr:BTAD domain-containing putative transcriptional regulator [Vicinamibacterales bacterium]